MNPRDSLDSVPADPPATSGQIPDDEGNAAELVDMGRRIAERETRDAVTERYVDEAYAGEDTEESLADLSRAEAAEDLATEMGPETNVLHKEIPSES